MIGCLQTDKHPFCSAQVGYTNMDPFAPGRSYSRRTSSSQDPRTIPGHPLYAPSASSTLPPPSPFGGSGRASSFGSSSGGMHGLPSPSDALRGPDRFEHSLDLPPLQTIPRSNSPILGRSSKLLYRITLPHRIFFPSYSVA